MNKNILHIDGIDLLPVNYNGIPCFTIDQIAFIQRSSDKTINKKIESIKQHLILGKDYFIIAQGGGIPRSYLLTMFGYLSLTKVLRGNSSWAARSALINYVKDYDLSKENL